MAEVELDLERPEPSCPEPHKLSIPVIASDELLMAICQAADVIACECPGYLARLVRQVRAFRSYTSTCIEQFPEDSETHQWLSDRALQVETILFQTIVELMQKEALLDEENNLVLDRLSTRSREIVLKQIGMAVS